MWPYQARRLSDLLSIDDIELFLGAAARGLALPITFFEAPPDAPSGGAIPIESLVRFDAPRQVLEETASPYVSRIRWGRHGAAAAFEGGDRAWKSAEARLAARVLANGAEGEASPKHARSPLGTTQAAVPVLFDNRALGVLVASGFLDDAEERSRLAKIVGKLGKLTQGEVRSLEEAGERVQANVRPASDAVRDELLLLVETVPVRGGEIDRELRRTADALSRLALGRLSEARRALEEELVREMAPPLPAFPLNEREIRRYAEQGIDALARLTRASHVALFAVPPARIDDELAKPALIAQRGLEPSSDHVADRAGTPFLEIDSAPFEVGPSEDPLERARSSVSALIGALRPSRHSPASWKDELTKSRLVIALETPTGSPWLVLLGSFPENIDPESEDLRFLWRGLEAFALRYQLAVSESGRRHALARLSRHEDANAPERKRGPTSPQRFDFRKLFDAVLDVHAEPARARRVSFDTKGLPERLMIFADRSKLGHVLDLLFDWARRNARPEGEGAAPSVIVGCRHGRGKGSWQISVDVLGEFLSREDRLRMIRRGAVSSPPAEGVTSEEARGAGGDGPAIGFSDAQRILGWHGGRLEVDCARTEPDPEDPNRWLGRTIFTATFRESAEGPSATATPRDETQRKGGRKGPAPHREERDRRGAPRRPGRKRPSGRDPEREEETRGENGAVKEDEAPERAEPVEGAEGEAREMHEAPDPQPERITESEGNTGLPVSEAEAPHDDGGSRDEERPPLG